MLLVVVVCCCSCTFVVQHVKVHSSSTPVLLLLSSRLSKKKLQSPTQRRCSSSSSSVLFFVFNRCSLYVFHRSSHHVSLTFCPPPLWSLSSRVVQALHGLSSSASSFYPRPNDTMRGLLARCGAPPPMRTAGAVVHPPRGQLITARFCRAPST